MNVSLFINPTPSHLPPSLLEGGDMRNWRFASAQRLQISIFAIFIALFDGRGRGACPQTWGWGEFRNIHILVEICQKLS